MVEFPVVCYIFGGFILFFGLVSLFVKEKLYISESLIATIFGLLLGQNGLNLIVIDHAAVEYLIFHFARIVVALQVISVGLSIPKHYVLREWISLFVLLVPLMFISWIVSTLIIFIMIGVDFNTSLIIGACITPTDPVLASGILKGKFSKKYIPVHLRHLITVESAANDGIGLPLLSLPLLIIKNNSLKIGMREWILKTWLYEIGFAIIIGGLLGVFANFVLRISKQKNLIDKDSLLVYLMALAFFTTGISMKLKIDDTLACFVCGLTFSFDKDFIKDIKQSHLLKVVDMVFNLTFFILFGLVFESALFGIKYTVCGILIILFRRLPFVYLFQKCIPQLRNGKEAFFAGWFGPIGVGAIFFSYHAKHELKEYGSSEHLQSFVYFIVLSSVFVHGLTLPIIHGNLKKNILIDEQNDYTDHESNYEIN